MYALAFTNNGSVGLGLKLYGLVMLGLVMAALLVFLRQRRR